MAEVVNTAIIGNFTCRVEADADADSAYGKLSRYDKAMESPGHHEMHRVPASIFVWDLYVLTSAGSGETKYGCRVKAFRPLTIWAMDVGCETAGGSAGTLNVFSDDGTTDESILDAAEDVKTTAGTCVRVAPEAAKADIAYGTELYIAQISTGGTMVGGQAHLYCQLQ